MSTGQSRNDTIRRFMRWIGEGDRAAAVALLEQSQVPQAGDVLLMALTAALHAYTPTRIGQPLTPVQTLSLVVTLTNGNAADHTIDPDDTGRVAEQARLLADSRVRGVFDTVQQALAAAVTQLGGPAEFGVPPYLWAELRDPNRDAAQQTLDEVELVAETNHGWFVRRAPGVGFVLFRTNDK